MNDIEITLTVSQLRELIERAEDRCYMLVQAVDGRWVRWVRITPTNDERP